VIPARSRDGHLRADGRLRSPERDCATCESRDLIRVAAAKLPIQEPSAARSGAVGDQFGIAGRSPARSPFIFVSRSVLCVSHVVVAASRAGRHRPSPPGRTRRNRGPSVRTLSLPRRSRGSPGDIRLASTPLGVVSMARITGPEIAARRTCDPRLVQPCPAAPLRVATADARRTQARPAAVVPAARRRRSTPTS
jgi:hypothetical protein